MSFSQVGCLHSVFHQDPSLHRVNTFILFLLTKVKSGVIYFNAFLFYTKSRFSWASFADPCCLDVLSSLCSSSSCQTNSTLLHS